jgi:hypothetical protein
MQFKKHVIAALMLTNMLIYPEGSTAHTPIRLINTKYGNNDIFLNQIKNEVKTNFRLDDYSEVKAQLIYNKNLKPDHFILYLLYKDHHSQTVARLNMNHRNQLTTIEKNYQLTPEDIAQQPGKSLAEAKCPDPSTEFIAFAPNDIAIEQSVTKEVIDAAKIQGLNTISLLLKNATRENYFNYSVCPQLKGFFFDGNSHPYFILASDGVITVEEIKSILEDKFRYKVTNIWVAGEAFEYPMDSALINTVKAQKFIAGINELTIGPSDRAGACTMKAAIYGKPITYSFEVCYKKYETELDEWGLGGNGEDFFGE